MSSVQSQLPVVDKADGFPGSAAPTVALQVGGTDGTNLRSLKTDTGGVLLTAHTDTAPVSQSISALDVGTASLVGANGQTFYTGSPTTNSAASFSIINIETVTIQVTLLGAGGTMVVEVSMDGGNLWLRPNVYQISTQSYANGFTSPFSAVVSTAAMTNIRVRSTVSWTGTATVIIRESINTRVVTVGDSLPSGSNVIGAIIGNAADGAADTGNPVKIAGSDGTNVQTLKTSTSGELVVTTRIALTASSPTQATIGVTSASALIANTSRKGLVLTNTSANRISIGFGVAAVLNSGVTLYPGGIFVMDAFLFNTAAVNAIASLAGSNLAIQEYT